MSIRFASRLAAVQAVNRKAAKAGLKAAAIVVQNRAREYVRGGFTSGKFVTGTGVRSITHKVLDADTAVVGTTLKYMAYWELGHQNLFTRKYEREEWLKPAMERTKLEQKAAAITVMRALALKHGIAAGLGIRGVK